MGTVFIPPAEIDAYKIGDRLGEGGMGAVFQATQVPLERTVAIKFIKHAKQTTPSAAAQARVQREAQAMARINSSYVAKIYNYHVSPWGPYLVSEFIEGRSLDRLPRPISNEKAHQIALHLALALEATHAAGVLHRDIKPSNAMEKPDGSIVLVDLGLAKLIDEAQEAAVKDEPRVVVESKFESDPGRTPSVTSDPSDEEMPITQELLTRAGQFVGTLQYAAPEVAKGEPATRLSDIYSLGALMYELCTGRPPRVARNRDELLKLLGCGEAPLLRTQARQVDRRFAAIVDRCLRSTKAERYKSARELRAALERLDTLPSRTLRWLEERNIFQLSLLGILVLLISPAAQRATSQAPAAPPSSPTSAVGSPTLAAELTPGPTTRAADTRPVEVPAPAPTPKHPKATPAGRRTGERPPPARPGKQGSTPRPVERGLNGIPLLDSD